MNFLHAMLQSAGVIPPEQDSGPMDIPVTAAPKRTIEEDTRSAPNQQRVMDELIPRKGMFGTKGTLRDVLGLLGDAFLVQSGNKPMYQPQRQQEKLGSALYGFTNDPQSAIERVAAINPEMAQDLYDKYSTNQVKLQQINQQGAKQGDESFKDYARLFSQYAGAANPTTYERIKPILADLKARGKLPDSFQIPDAYDKELLQSYQYGGMPAQQQVSDVRREQGLGIQQQNADSNRIRATRPPAPHNPPRRGFSDIEAEAFDTPAAKRTPEQQDIVRNRLTPKGRGSALSRILGGGTSSSGSASKSGWGSMTVGGVPLQK